MSKTEDVFDASAGLGPDTDNGKAKTADIEAMSVYDKMARWAEKMEKETKGAEK